MTTKLAPGDFEIQVAKNGLEGMLTIVDGKGNITRMILGADVIFNLAKAFVEAGHVCHKRARIREEKLAPPPASAPPAKSALRNKRRTPPEQAKH